MNGKLEYIQTDFCLYEDRFCGFSALKPLKEQIVGMSFNTDEYGLLEQYWVSLIITSKKLSDIAMEGTRRKSYKNVFRT